MDQIYWRHDHVYENDGDLCASGGQQGKKHIFSMSKYVPKMKQKTDHDHF